jgi:hypothetical protein
MTEQALMEQHALGEGIALILVFFVIPILSWVLGKLFFKDKE